MASVCPPLPPPLPPIPHKYCLFTTYPREAGFRKVRIFKRLSCPCIDGSEIPFIQRVPYAQTMHHFDVENLVVIRREIMVLF